MAWTKESAFEYAKEAKSAVFASLCTKTGAPRIRSVGGYGLSDGVFYLNTAKDSAKVRQIQNRADVTILFQHEGQEVPKNVTFFGQASLLSGDEAEKAREIIKARRPQAVFDDTKVIVKVQVEKIKILDFSEDEKVQEIEL